MGRRFYILGALVGTFVPWIFFTRFITIEGLNIQLFIQQLFGSAPAAGFSSDVLISLFVFWVWSFFDARDIGINRWWWTVPAGLAVGLSLAMPLYFILRQTARHRNTQAGKSS